MSEGFFGRPDFVRGRYGWAEITQPDGSTKLYRRVTTVAGYMDDKQGLIDWSAAKVARGVALNKGLQSSFALLTWEEDKSKVKDLVTKAKGFGGGDDAAEIGTAFHKVIEAYHGGKAIDSDILPEGFAEALESYKQFIEDHGITVRASELTIVDDAHEVAGTADLVYSFDSDTQTPFGVIPADVGIISDVKTGSVSDLSGLKMGMQLGIYANGTPYDAGLNERTKWPVDMFTDIGLILKVDLATGKVAPWWLNLKAAYELVPMSLKVDQIRKDGKKLIALAPIAGGKVTKPERKPAKPSAKEIREAMGKANTLAELQDVEAKYGQHFTESQNKAFASRVAALTEKDAEEHAEPLNTAEAPPGWDDLSEPEKPAEPAEPVDDYSVEHAKRAAEAAANKGELRTIYTDFSRRGADPDALKILTDYAQNVPGK